TPASAESACASGPNHPPPARAPFSYLISCVASRSAQSQPGAVGMVQQESAIGEPSGFRTCAPRVFHHSEQIQDQHNVPISKDGSAVHQISGEGLVVQSFDYQLFFSF